MRRFLAFAALASLAVPAGAALPVGAKAPEVVTTGAMAGKAFHLDLQRELRKGPVVLYFFPKAFTQGCDLEAHAFSEAAAKFHKAGAEVIGMSADNLPILKQFSVKKCSSAFPVATATPETIRAYDVAFDKAPGLTNRTSYVIAPDGTVISAYSNGDFKGHVPTALAALREWKAKKRH